MYALNHLFQRAVTMIPAHDNPLAALAFNATGTKIATASEKVKLCSFFLTAFVYKPKSVYIYTSGQIHIYIFLFQGTVIRVFSVPDGQKLFEFRRGVKRWAFKHCFPIFFIRPL